MEEKQDIVPWDECMEMGEQIRESLVETVIHALEARHPAESGYYNRLCLELAAADTILEDSNPQAYEELVSTVREEYRKLDDGQKHLLYLLELDPDDDEEFVTLEGLCRYIEEGMEDQGWGLLQEARGKGTN